MIYRVSQKNAISWYFGHNSTRPGNTSVLLSSFSNGDLISQFSSRDPTLECVWSTGRTGPGGRANAASLYATFAMCGNTGNFIQQIGPHVFDYLRLKKHESDSYSFESLMYMNKERCLAKRVLWINHSHDTRNLLYRFPGSAGWFQDVSKITKDDSRMTQDDSRMT